MAAPSDAVGPAGVNPRLRANVLGLFGSEGRAWLDDLPAHLERLSLRWALRLGPPYSDLSYHYVAPGLRADGRAVVLKTAPPHREMESEAAALAAWDGRGAVRLLEADLSDGALLLERLRPGRSLAALADDGEATARAAEVMRRLWRPPPATARLPGVADWGLGFARMRARHGGGSGPLPAAHADRAERIFARLLASQAEPVLLHGDLHQDNILDAGTAGWRAIDPKGVLGEPACEVGAWMRNPMPGLVRDPNPAPRIAARLDRFAATLGLDRARLAGWSYAQALLSAWWFLEDGAAPDAGWLADTERLHALLAAELPPAL